MSIKEDFVYILIASNINGGNDLIGMKRAYSSLEKANEAAQRYKEYFKFVTVVQLVYHKY